MFKKFLISTLLSIYLLTSFLVPVAHAQTPVFPNNTWYSQDYLTWYLKVIGSDTDEIFGERYTYAQVEWVIYSLITFILNSGTKVSTVGGTSSLFYTPNMYAVNTWYSVFTQNPLSGITYVKGIAQKLNLVKEVHAQQVGFGFSAASAVQELWKVVRNLSYFLSVVVLVVMAFMIMFRVKISPQTVITVESALPKVIIGLILITFSYAIAGFLIDLMYVSVGILTTVIENSGLSPSGTWPELFTEFTQATGVITLMGQFFLGFSIVTLYYLSTGFFAGVGLLVWIVTAIVMIFVLLVATLKTVFMLLKTFVSLILLIAVAPLQILVGILGFGGGFGGWFKEMISRLAIYPVVCLMFFLAFLFLRAGIPNGIAGTTADPLGQLQFLITHFPFGIAQNPLGTTAWVPPLTWDPVNIELFWLFISVMIVTLIPKTAEIIQSLFSGKPYGYGSAIGQGLGVAGGMGMMAVGGLSASEAARYAGLQRTPPPGGIPRRYEIAHGIMSGIRAVSGGKIR